ncbi:MAG: histidinol dehydrogenase [Oscillospiraceae bacterium]|nr:histidinol dehydrogenase [Oscillospiraceae bacterium]MCM0704688.1 histidinol dehydrogenase [Faecalicatena sp. BF-R-105]MDY3218450.1 histidinol dehydrogenase [Candidatus Fimivivens sp.]GKH49693.1 histidinol dehydrogenase [Eubacteriales bacterium]MCI6026987.1 histidinol dehydrogenase [Oscillospiraceae bacterium]
MIQTVKADGRAEYEFFERMRSRSRETKNSVAEAVEKIIEAVRVRGDEAVREYTVKFDRRCPEAFEVGREIINDALTAADHDFVSALLNAQENVAAFHQRQKTQSFLDPQKNGVILGQRVRGLHRVGLYVPGGTAAYPSSVLMNAIPAKIAGVGELVMVTPPGPDGRPNPDILVAAAICGVDRVFLMGGAQAVAALAYGTESVPRCDKIVGPGNIFVATAKRLLYGTVDIDMIAGPSEILIIADDSANPKYLAADLMGQAEHDRMASAVLLTTSGRLVEQTKAELARQIGRLERREIIEASLADFGAIVLCESEAQMVALANELAPEHLEVQVADPMRLLGVLDNAGSVFLGEYTPEPLGDYYAGPNHVLPTSGTARFFSPLGVDSFVKRSAFLYYPREAMAEAAPDILTIAAREGLLAHANAVKVRLEDE